MHTLTPRTKNVGFASGCIEDRYFEGAETGELNQVPGADIFFSVSRDIAAVDKKGEPSHATLKETVLEDVVRLGSDYVVHNDADHGGKFDGCGFAAKLPTILRDIHKNISLIINGLDLTKEQTERAIGLAEATGKLNTHTAYLSAVGGELVQAAVEAGATCVTYKGDHTARSLTIDTSSSSTYDSLRANAEQTTSFNLDVNHARGRAGKFGLNPEDTEVFAQIASLATVRVLSNGAITEATYIRPVTG